jgi:hypothetical protein
MNSSIPILPYEILIEIAKADMIAFGLLIRTCWAIWRPFASLTRQDRIALVLTWRTRNRLFHTESYYEYRSNGRSIPHILLMRHDDNGRILEESEMWLGKRQGKCVTYYEYSVDTLLEPNSCIRTREWYVDDKLHGKFLEYHDNGILWCDCRYKHGKLDGEYRTYHDNGRLHQIKYYVDGVATGEWFEYDRNGCLRAHGFGETITKRRCVIV